MLSKRSQRIKPSPTLAIDAKAKEMKAEGLDVISFAVGEPDFDTPDNIKQAAYKAIKDGFTKYTPAGGIPQLKNAIIAKCEKDNTLKYTQKEVVISCGAKHSLYNLFQALLSPGDEVIIPAPYWVSYPDQVLLNDGEPVFIQCDEKDNFMLNVDALKEKITKKTKAIVLNYPSNPTGFTYDKKTLENIAETVVQHNLYVIADEIYEKLLYDGIKHISIASLSDDIKKRTFLVNGPSKTYSMTGWRIGYTCGDGKVMEAVTNIQSQSTSNPCSISQMACVEALNGTQEFISQMLYEFDKRRIYIVSELNKIEGLSCIKPEGAFYAFARIDAFFGKSKGGVVINNSQELSLYLLEDGHVALVPGSAFGAEGYIRMSYATSMENIQEGIKRIKTALNELR
ncbi:class I and II aminotransferase [Candidatus Magnetoovum chiemensis]|nr:class I and II aminotransferase [Candidatus Magnetoovum chiemensis]